MRYWIGGFWMDGHWMRGFWLDEAEPPVTIPSAIPDAFRFPYAPAPAGMPYPALGRPLPSAIGVRLPDVQEGFAPACPYASYPIAIRRRDRHATANPADIAERLK